MKIAFRIKLFLFCVVIILSISIPIAIITYNYMYNSIKNDLILDSKKKMEDVDNNISDIIDQMKQDAKTLANLEEVKKGDNSILALFNIPNVENDKKYSKQIPGIESDIYNKFELYALTHRETEYVCFGTKWGGYIQWPDGLNNSNYDPRERPWYSLAMNKPDEVMISDPHKVAIDTSKNIAISACTTVRNTSGDIVGVVAVDTSLNKLSEIINSVKIGDSGYAFFYLDDGTILAHPNSNLNFKNINDLVTLYSKRSGNDGFSMEDIDKLLHMKNDSFEAIVNGNEAFVDVYTSPYNGWKMAAVIPKSELTSKVSVLEKTIFGITVCILLLGIALTYLVVITITDPIRKLTTLMESAGNGDLSVRADFKTKDEFGKLSDSFNSMIKDLSSNYEELTAVHEELVATEEELRTQYDELQYNEEALRNSEERYVLALECANDSIWEWNLITGEFFASDKLINIIGYKLDASNKMGRIFKNIIHPDDFERAREDFKNHIKNITEIFDGEYRVKTTDGSYVWILCKGKAIRNSEGKAIKLAGSISDISERKISEEKIKFMAYYDGLTQLPNKTLFMEKLTEQLEIMKNHELEGAVIFIDLDDFKYINDIMGHKFGDKLIVDLAEKIEGVIEQDDTICRFGGDEFIILKPSIKESEIYVYLNRLLSIFNESFKIDNRSISITASIGAALYPKDGDDPETLLKNADSAMYKAKELGKNRFSLYAPEIYIQLERRTSIESILRKAIENNEFSINYQPQYDAVNNEIFGFEALLRLNSEKLGFISPAEFIPIAEACGYITKIGLWVLQQACMQSVKWLDEGFKFRSMSVNISSADLQQKDFIENVAEIIRSTGINPNTIELEITETVLMQSFESSIIALEKLMDMGIRIALDDFGTGYSSLNYLRKIPISTLKIDKSFIDNIVSSKKEESLISDMIQMAHTMQLKIVAEGVETKEQLFVLKDKKCDYIQGYYFSKPLPAEEIKKIFEQ